jgi:hypothetical protein
LCGFIDIVKLFNNGIGLVIIYFEAANPPQYKMTGYSFISQVGFESAVLVSGSPWRGLHCIRVRKEVFVKLVST